MKTIKFGNYPQNENGEIEDIEWNVIDENEHELLLISTKCLDAKKYHNTQEYVEWANCDLRKWLNSDFYNAAFSFSEKERILAVNNKNTTVVFGKFLACQETVDKVFILSIDELGKYLHIDYIKTHNPELEAFVTKYATKRGADYDIIKGRGTWWLRTCKFNSGAYCIGFLGVLLTAGEEVSDEDCSVRPVIKIRKISKDEQIIAELKKMKRQIELDNQVLFEQHQPYDHESKIAVAIALKRQGKYVEAFQQYMNLYRTSGKLSPTWVIGAFKVLASGGALLQAYDLVSACTNYFHLSGEDNALINTLFTHQIYFLMCMLGHLGEKSYQTFNLEKYLRDISGNPEYVMPNIDSSLNLLSVKLKLKADMQIYEREYPNFIKEAWLWHRMRK